MADCTQYGFPVRVLSRMSLLLMSDEYTKGPNATHGRWIVLIERADDKATFYANLTFLDLADLRSKPVESVQKYAEAKLINTMLFLWNLKTVEPKEKVEESRNKFDVAYDLGLNQRPEKSEAKWLDTILREKLTAIAAELGAEVYTK
jgi:hypothetical protein